MTCWSAASVYCRNCVSLRTSRVFMRWPERFSSLTLRWKCFRTTTGLYKQSLQSTPLTWSYSHFIQTSVSLSLSPRLSAAVEKVELLWQQAFSKPRLHLQVAHLQREAQQVEEKAALYTHTLTPLWCKPCWDSTLIWACVVFQIQEQIVVFHREKVQPYRIQSAEDVHRAESQRLEFESLIYTHAMVRNVHRSLQLSQ